MAGYGSVDSVHDYSSLEGGPSSGAPEQGVEPEDPDGQVGLEPESRGKKPRPRWGWRHSLLAVLVFIVVAAVIAWFIQLPYYALTPGAAPEVSSLIKVPSSNRHPHHGSVLLVYVELTPM